MSPPPPRWGGPQGQGRRVTEADSRATRSKEPVGGTDTSFATDCARVRALIGGIRGREIRRCAVGAARRRKPPRAAVALMTERQVVPVPMRLVRLHPLVSELKEIARTRGRQTWNQGDARGRDLKLRTLRVPRQTFCETIFVSAPLPESRNPLPA